MSALDEVECRSRLARARVARLGTVRPSGEPHLVPLCFVLDEDRLVTAVDGKPKSTDQLARVRNIASNPRVSLLVDEWDEDWSQLWWVRADGLAHLASGDDAVRAELLLRAKYRQYETVALDGPFLVIEVSRWSGWSAT